jgi:putative spermidine/putrescine transport system permease protein
VAERVALTSAQRPTTLWSAVGAARLRPYLGLVPIVVYVAIFLLVPAWGVLAGALTGSHHTPSLAALRTATRGAFAHALVVSLELSVTSAVVACVLGTATAIAIVTLGSERLVRIASSVAAVLANTGGVPLAFAFVATLGNFGAVTLALAHLGFNPYAHGFSLYSVTGLVIVYQYFLLPLMVLIALPALSGLRREWREAVATLGGTPRHFWRYVGLPLLAPTLLAGLLVLFADAFAAYATAAALAGGVIPLVPLEIGNLIAGNVVANQANVGDALGLEMILVVAVTSVIYAVAQRRQLRWSR